MKHLTPMLLAALAAVTILGCEETGVVTADAGVTPGRDGGPPPMAFAYTPEGCGYQVSTPANAAIEAGPGGAAVGGEPTPVFVHASFAGPAASSFAVNWRTDNDTTMTRLLYGPDPTAVAAAAGAAAEVRAQAGHEVLFTTLLGTQIRLHEVHVCGLSPSTLYYYKVGGPGAWSEVFEITTGPEIGSTEPWRFAVTGDSRNDSVVWAEIQTRILEQAADLQIFSGDAVVLGANQPEWDGFFGDSFEGTSVQDVLAQIPLMPANGNHDGLALNYVLQFALPQDRSPDERAEGEEWYSFDYGNAHFVVLNDTAGEALVTGSQATWLEADLAAVDRDVTPWLFVMHHKPMYSCSTNHGSDIPLRNAWQQIYDRHGVDVVFNGHDHDYERSLPIRGFQSGTNEGAVAASGPNGIPVSGSGTIYLVAAGAGAPLYGVDPSCYHTYLTESVRNYVVIDIDGPTMRFLAYRIDGTVLDQFEYTK